MSNRLDSLLNNVQVLAIVCNQFGDTGKGKIVDLLAERAEVIARGQGGANAGHTVVVGDKEYIFHIIPSGILYDSDGKVNVIGRGVAFDPRVVIEELDALDSARMSYRNLKLSRDAILVLPHHIVWDKLKNVSLEKGNIGTTGRGIGPAYSDHIDRRDLKLIHILNKDTFAKKLTKSLEDKKVLLSKLDRELVKRTVCEIDRKFYSPRDFFDLDTIVQTYCGEYAYRFRDMMQDTDEFMRKSLADNKKILLEGAQGFWLSVDYGTSPYATSSDCSIEGLAKGVGLKERDVDLTLGIIKGFYMTRVGNGPFPTEFGEEKSERYCAAGLKHDLFSEAVRYLGLDERYTNLTLKEKQEKKQEVICFIKKNRKKVAELINSSDEFEKGVGIRLAGFEYGATTSRPRRIGWLDLPLLRGATQINGANVILTKLDVLDDAEKIKICHSYKYTGKDYDLGNTVLRAGDILRIALPYPEVLNYCKPVYDEFSGWLTDISNTRNYEKLPKELRNIIRYVAKEANVNPKIVSVGRNRDETIFL